MMSAEPGRTRKRPRAAPTAWQARLKLLPLLLPALLAAAWALPYAWTQLRADFGTLDTRVQVTACNPATAAAWPEDKWQRLQRDLLQGIQTNPADPVLRDALARLYTCKGLSMWASEEARTYWFAAARTAYEASLALRPDNPPALAGLAVALSSSGAPAAEVNGAWLRALKFGPKEQDVKLALKDLALRHWTTAEPEMKRWMRQQFRDAEPERKKQLLKQAARFGVTDLQDPAAPAAVQPGP